MPLPRDTTLLRMAAVDAGFDLGPDAAGTWMKYNSAGNMATVWLNQVSDGSLVAVAPERVAAEVGQVYGVDPWIGEKPPGSAFAWRTPSRVALGEVLRRIAVLGRVLTDQVLHQYNAVIDAEIENALAESPLERIVEVRQRVGQDLYRTALMQYWDGRCSISGISIPTFLRASHAKPRRDTTDRERLG